MVIEYETIHNILARYNNKELGKYDKVNFYGVITHVSQSDRSKDKLSCVTFVDQSCVNGEKFRCNIFNEPSDEITIKSSCVIGDIIRCHRFFVQTFNEKAQGVGQHSICSWVRFKSNEEGMDSVSSKNCVLEEDDANHVTELRNWLKTNPDVDALIEAQLAQSHKSKIMSTIPTNIPSYYLRDLKQLVKLSEVHEGYLDIICQVCAICKKKDSAFIVAWDGTEPNDQVYKESDFELFSQNEENIEASEVFYNESIKNFLTHIFVFDEYVDILKTIKPGDYILLRNTKILKVTHLESNANLILKLPGVALGSNLHKRTILKLTDYKRDTSNLIDYPNITALINFIGEKAKENDVGFVGDRLFLTSFQSVIISHDETFDTNSANKQPMCTNLQNLPIPDQINALTERAFIKAFQINERAKLLRDESDRFQDITDESSYHDPLFPPMREDRRVVDLSLMKKTTEKITGVAETIQSSVTQKASNKEALKSLENRPITEPIQKSPVKRSSTKNDSKPVSSRQLGNIDENPLDITEDLSSEETCVDVMAKRQKTNTKEAYFDYEICPEIHLLNERLTRFTYLVPFLSTKSISGAKYLPYFLSLSGLKEEAVKNKFMKAKIEARIFDYSLQAPPYASIYVRCRKCQYINFAPFHCVRALQPSFLNYMLKNYETDIGNTQFMTQQQENDDFEKKRLECSKDFSLRWLNTAEVLGWEESSDRNVKVPNYHCPRCELTCPCSRCTDEYDSKDEVIQVQADSVLEYIYRFWFYLRDNSGNLEPVLFEGDEAKKFLDNINPIDFFTSKKDRNTVFMKIYISLNLNCLFTIESFRLRSADQTSDEDLIKNRQLKTLYKIVEVKKLSSV